MKFILGTKLSMTQVYREDGAVVPVTRVKAGPCVITEIKKDAIQIGFGLQKKFRINKPEMGHLKDIKIGNDDNLTVRVLRDVKGEDEKLNRGDVFTVNVFAVGDKVQVTGKSKGKGFQGVIKRHGFHGSKATHGNKDQERASGSIGATDAARVFRGTKMGGHMGDARVTVQNLEILGIDLEENELLIKGAVPGARGGLLLISTDKGEMIIEDTKVEEIVEDKIVEDVKVEKEIKKDDTKKTSEEVKPSSDVKDKKETK